MRQTQATIYLPPVLPEYLKNVYDLKPINGAPNDDEVKGIHAVIRAAQNAAQIPGMFDPHLSMGLAQHLFEVQMARYRVKYPCGMFPDDMVHTPPTLPSHVTFALEAVVGVPSDEELQAVQAAMRGYEQMAVFPSMFDPSISMELSQHLFNIQLARYMHNAPHAGLGSESRSSEMKKNATGSGHAPPQARQPVDTTSELSDGELPDAPNESGASNPPTTQQSTPPPQAESNDQLTKIVDVLEGIKKVLVRTQQDRARASGFTTCIVPITHCRDEKGTATYTYPSVAYTAMSFETMNEKGELPTDQGLPLLRRNGYGAWQISQLSDEHLARYLQFYNLDGDLVHQGDALSIQSNKREDAVTVLTNYISSHIRPS